MKKDFADKIIDAATPFVKILTLLAMVSFFAFVVVWSIKGIF